MNRIVRDHYPVSQLPEDLRQAAGNADHVRLTLELLPSESRRGSAPAHRRKSRLAELGISPEGVAPVSISDIRSIATPRGTSVRSAVRRIRRQRQEQDD